MEVTLRKAAAIESALRGFAKELPLTTTVTASIFSDKTVAEAAGAVVDTLLNNVAEAERLFAAAVSIRQAISVANSSNGINKLLTERVGLDATEKLLTPLVSKADRYGFEEVDGMDIAQAHLDSLRERQKTGSDRGYGNETSLTITVMKDDVKAKIRDKLATIQRRKVDIADELLVLNMSQKVVLSEDVVAIAKARNLV